MVEWTQPCSPSPLQPDAPTGHHGFGVYFSVASGCKILFLFFSFFFFPLLFFSFCSYLTHKMVAAVEEEKKEENGEENGEKEEA